MQNELKIKKTLLFLGDIAVLYISLFLALLIRYQKMPTSDLWQSHFYPFSIIFAGWIIIFYIAGLYNLHIAVNNTNFFRTSLRSIAIAGLTSAAFFYLTPQIAITPKRNLLIYLIIFFVLFYAWRSLYNGLLGSYLPKNNIAIIGLNNQTKGLINELVSKPHLGYIVSFVFDGEITGEEKIGYIPVIRDTKNLENIITEKKIDTIILASSPHQSEELRAILFNCLPLKISYVNLPNFYEAIAGKIPTESINQMWFLENLSEGDKRWFDILKRGYDIMLALLILILSIIFWPIIALFIKLESKGPVFFTQIRSGKNNKPFKIIKFRTMAISNNDFSPTRADDKRITLFGSFLRKTRIDELPQVINILKGDMSFVGPRPERPELIKELEQRIPFYHERMLVKPGVTGSDQISGEYHSPSYEDSLKKLQYDLFYIKNRSIYLDLSIILKTIATILSRKGV